MGYIGQEVNGRFLKLLMCLKSKGKKHDCQFDKGQTVMARRRWSAGVFQIRNG